MFSSPFPEQVVFVEINSGSFDPRFELHPEEKAVLHANASTKRVREFTLGRLGARRALQGLGLESPPPIVSGKRGEPIWPSGIVGSISHSDDLAVVAAARTTTARALGLDLQSLRRGVDENIARRVCNPEEMAWCVQNPNELQLRLLAVFSAKETLFKTLYPLSQAVFYFLDAQVEYLPERRAFRAVLLKDLKGVFASGSEYEIGFLSTGNMILTSMLLA